MCIIRRFAHLTTCEQIAVHHLKKKKRLFLGHLLPLWDCDRWKGRQNTGAREGYDVKQRSRGQLKSNWWRLQLCSVVAYNVTIRQPGHSCCSTLKFITIFVNHSSVFLKVFAEPRKHPRTVEKCFLLRALSRLLFFKHFDKQINRGSFLLISLHFTARDVFWYFPIRSSLGNIFWPNIP